jgi:hypothetical protein
MKRWTLISLALALAALVPALSPAAHAQTFGATVVEAFFTEPDAPVNRLFDTRKGRCAGVVDAAGSALTLHCGHNFTEPSTVTLFRIAGGAEVLRQELEGGDFYVDLELTPPIRQALRRGDLGIRVTGDDRVATGELEPPASATGSSVRLEVDLLDADGVAGGSCTALLLGIGSPMWLFDLYLDCQHELEGPVTAGLFDRNPRSRLKTGPDDLLADLGDARTPVLLDWRIDGGLSPVGGFFGGSQEIVVTGEQRELRAFLDGCMAGGESVCLHQRFQVSSRYEENVTGEGLLVPARPLTFSPGAALFSFTDPEQVEVVVNLDDRCADTGFYALRASGMSEQRPRVTLIDTATGEQREVELFRGAGQGGAPDPPLSVIDSRAFPCE